MPGPDTLDMTLLPGARTLLAAHARELPQRDDLCGAFCGALALRAAGIDDHGDEPLDQDAVALAAGSVVSGMREPGTLPHGELGRRDYRLSIPSIEDSDLSGTTAAGLASAVALLSGGALEAIPYTGPWSASTLAGLFDLAAALERPVTLVANFATRHLWGARPSVNQLLGYLFDGDGDGPPPDWDVGHFACVFGRVRGPRGSLYAVADTYPALGDGGVHMQPQEHLATALERRDMPAGGMFVVASADDAAGHARGRGCAGTRRRHLGQRHRHRRDAQVSTAELVALVCCDLGAIVRGRSVLCADLDEHLRAGIGWVPANHALTPLGPVAEPNPFGSTGDLRLLPDAATRVLVGPDGDHGALELMLCDIVETDGQPWECCPRSFLRDTLRELRRELDARLVASFEHEFQLLGPSDPGGAPSIFDRSPPALPFTLEAQRRVEPFPAQVMGALVDAGVEPERFFAEYAPHQFEIPVAPAEGLASADRAVVLREVVREIARRQGMRASFVPLLHPEQAGNGVHIHLSLLDARGNPLLYDDTRPACLSELGGRFAAGILRHARALSALTAASPVSGARLQPHRWSAGAVCLAQRNREALLRIPPLLSLADADPAGQLHLEYRGADATANPHLALGAILRAGLEGVRARLPAPPILERDPAQLDAGEAERFGVGALPATLEGSLQALADDATARGWMTPLLYDAYTSVKRAELDAAADVELEEVCRRYAAIY